LLAIGMGNENPIQSNNMRVVGTSVSSRIVCTYINYYIKEGASFI
jgi:hypothetical protein